MSNKEYEKYGIFDSDRPDSFDDYDENYGEGEDVVPAAPQLKTVSERERWMNGWVPSSKNSDNICKHIGDGKMPPTVFIKDGDYIGIYDGEVTDKYYNQDHAKAELYEKVYGKKLPPKEKS
jgi:hypothetical protein